MESILEKEEDAEKDGEVMVDCNTLMDDRLENKSDFCSSGEIKQLKSLTGSY